LKVKNQGITLYLRLNLFWEGKHQEADLTSTWYMSKITATKSNFLFNVALTVSNLLFPLISFPYVSRIIGPHGIGKVQFLMTFAQYFVLFASLGIPIYGIREVAKRGNNRHELSKLFSELFVINIISSILMILVYCLVIFSFNKFQKEIDLYLITGLVILLGFTTIDWFYSGLEEFKFITIRSIIIKLLSLIGLFVFVHSPSDVNLYLYITVFSIIGNNIWNLIYLNKKVSFRLDNLKLKRHLPTLFILFSTSISTSIYTVMDTLLLGFLTNDTTVGFYTAAIKINKIAIPVIVSLGVVLMPQISKAMADKNIELTQKLIDKSFSFICLIGIPVCFGMFVFAPEIMYIFSGPQFGPAIITMQIASPLVFLIGLGHVFGLQILVPGNHQKYYLYATICGMLVSLLLNFFLIQLFNEKGAATATVLGEIVVSIVAYYYVVTKMKYSFDWSLIIKAIASSILFLPIVFAARHFFPQNFVVLLLGSITSCIIYFLFQVFIFKNDLSRDLIAFAMKKVGLQRFFFQ
jgi:O-antigen/teichoic acid export membrane protein